MRLILVLLLLLPVLCVKKHTDPRELSDDEFSRDGVSALTVNTGIVEEEDVEGNLPMLKTTVSGAESSLSPFQRLRLPRSPGRRRGKGKNKKGGRKGKGKGRRKGGRWWKPRRIRLLGNRPFQRHWPKALNWPVRPSIIRLAVKRRDCSPMRYRGIVKAVLKCADTDVDTFMDFVVMTVGNSSLIESLAGYPEEEQKQLEEMLRCLGKRKRWHKTDNLTEVLDELRQKQAFMHISPCLTKFGRNCSWEEEKTFDWLLCMEEHCQEVVSHSASIKPPEVLEAQVPATMTCDVTDATSNVTVTWWSGAHQFHHHHEEYFEDRHHVQSQLSITPSSQDDGRVLVCRADKDGAIVEDYWMMSVNFSPQVSLAFCPSNISLADLDARINITLRCMVKSNPLADTITWWHNRLLLNEDPSSGATFSNDYQDLNIQMNEDSLGSYTCQAANTIGKEESEECVLEITDFETDKEKTDPVVYVAENNEAELNSVYDLDQEKEAHNPFAPLI